MRSRARAWLFVLILAALTLLALPLGSLLLYANPAQLTASAVTMLAWLLAAYVLARALDELARMD
jgi:hypothetical protein